MSLFILLPIVSFMFGRYYQSVISSEDKLIDTYSYLNPTTQQRNIEWKTYQSSSDGPTFNYPSDWKIKAISQDKYSEDLFFTSPNGFELQYLYTVVQGGPSICKSRTDACPNITNYNSTPVFIKNWKTLYLINGQLKMSLNLKNDSYKAVYLSDVENSNYAVIAGGGVGFNSYIKSKNNLSKFIVFEGHFPSYSSQQKLNYKDYFELEDVQIAVKIIHSLSY